MDFNKITEEQEQLAIVKFKEHGKGVMMGTSYMVHNDDNSQKWADLIDQHKWSERHIKEKMLHIARIITTTCNDEMLGNQNVMFNHVDEFDKKISYTYIEAYSFLRGALRYRRNTAEYRAKKSKLEELNKFVEQNKTVTEKRREAKAEIQKLQKELDIS